MNVISRKQQADPLNCLKTIICIVFCLILVLSGLVNGATLRRYPCDPKFGFSGNYIEITTGDIVSSAGVSVCFDIPAEKETRKAKTWLKTLMSRVKKQNYIANEKTKDCLRLESLPGRFQNKDGSWTSWEKKTPIRKANTVYQFALCGTLKDDSVWQNFQRHLTVDSWDKMEVLAETGTAVFIARVRVVQNRVRILDDESREEGIVNFFLNGDIDEQNLLQLSGRIRTTKLNRLNCLNMQSGKPYCEQSVLSTDNQEIPPQVHNALLELGHSGSKKYGRVNNAYCSEFVVYLLKKSTQLSSICNIDYPSPAAKDVNVKDIHRWFQRCGRVIKREKIRETIRLGDFISTDNLKHSAIFLGWVDQEKKYFWEISGNNRCKPERETFYADNNKANMVCISKKEFDKYVLDDDIGGRISSDR